MLLQSNLFEYRPYIDWRCAIAFFSTFLCGGDDGPDAGIPVLCKPRLATMCCLGRKGAHIRIYRSLRIRTLDISIRWREIQSMEWLRLLLSRGKGLTSECL